MVWCRGEMVGGLGRHKVEDMATVARPALRSRAGGEHGDGGETRGRTAASGAAMMACVLLSAARSSPDNGSRAPSALCARPLAPGNPAPLRPRRAVALSWGPRDGGGQGLGGDKGKDRDKDTIW